MLVFRKHLLTYCMDEPQYFSAIIVLYLRYTYVYKHSRQLNIKLIFVSFHMIITEPLK